MRQSRVACAGCATAVRTKSRAPARRSSIVPSTLRTTPASGQSPMNRAGAMPSRLERVRRWSCPRASPGRRSCPARPARSRTMIVRLVALHDEVATTAQCRARRRDVVVRVTGRQPAKGLTRPGPTSINCVAQFTASAAHQAQRGVAQDTTASRPETRAARSPERRTQ